MIMASHSLDVRCIACVCHKVIFNCFKIYWYFKWSFADLLVISIVKITITFLNKNHFWEKKKKLQCIVTYNRSVSTDLNIHELKGIIKKNNLNEYQRFFFSSVYSKSFCLKLLIVDAVRCGWLLQILYFLDSNSNVLLFVYWVLEFGQSDRWDNGKIQKINRYYCLINLMLTVNWH